MESGPSEKMKQADEQRNPSLTTESWVFSAHWDINVYDSSSEAKKNSPLKLIYVN